MMWMNKIFLEKKMLCKIYKTYIQDKSIYNINMLFSLHKVFTSEYYHTLLSSFC